MDPSTKSQAPEKDADAARILSGPLAIEMLRFGGPLALGMALQTTFNLADAYLIARLPAAEVGAAVGALGMCDQVTALGTIISYGISTATAVVISQQKGAQDQAGIVKTTYQSFLIIGALSLLFALLGMFGSGFVVRSVIGAKGAVAEVGEQYLRVMVGGSFSIFLLLHFSNLQRALGSAKTPVMLMVLGNIINVVLAIVLVFGEGPAPGFLSFGAPIAKALHIPRMGMMGAAWATIISRTMVLVPNAVLAMRRFRMTVPRGIHAHPDLPEIRRILSLAWPSSTQFFLRIAATLLVNSLVARFYTTETDQTASTAMGLVFRLDTLALFVAMGWGSGAQTFVGQNLGAGNPDRAYRAGLFATAYQSLTGAMVIVLVFLHGPGLLRFFGDEPRALAMGVTYLRDVAPSYIPLGIGVTLGGAIVGSGATRTALITDACVILLVQLPLALISAWALHADIEWLFRSVTAANVGFCLAYLVVYTRRKWLTPHGA